MLKNLILAVFAFFLSFSSVLAATVNQVGEVNPGDVGVSFDVDFGPFSGDLVSFAIAFSTGSEPLRFLSAQDDPSDGGTAPTYSLFANAGGSIAAIASGAGGVATTNPAFSGPYILQVTNNNLPTDNLSSARFNFLIPSTIAPGKFSVDFVSALTVRDANDVEMQLAAQKGSFDLLVNSPAPIPLPAGGFLIVTGLGALALMRRRKTAL